ncbi:MAG TPA: prepilin-type N-terminal cleavage/methylation domain-containing protein [Candidatus Paceibacterota bacterium]|jgi:prepilin-type N-terminal cleavage/methylation domain-containing protein|nr:prepilin-type N-terminal cleavage/methylation domain-containing protein [Candidatus Paceibacterota bacterium]
MKKKYLKTNKGYTIIETMIAISLFLVVVMVGMGALLSANLVHQKSESMRDAVDSLSFILEDVSRNLRTGYHYHCVDDGNFKASALIISRSCESGGGGIAFEYQDGSPGDDNDQWAYKIESPDGIEPFNIYKSIDSGQTWVQLNPPEVTIDPSSLFEVIGAEPPDEDGGGNHEQPFVTIRLIGKITFKNVETPFSLQTSVSQRIIDI